MFACVCQRDKHTVCVLESECVVLVKRKKEAELSRRDVRLLCNLPGDSSPGNEQIELEKLLTVILLMKAAAFFKFNFISFLFCTPASHTSIFPTPATSVKTTPRVVRYKI